MPARGETVVNWSGTHSVQPKAFYQPESAEDVEAIVADCHAKGRRLRVMGSALSPNGASFSGAARTRLQLLAAAQRGAAPTGGFGGAAPPRRAGRHAVT